MLHTSFYFFLSLLDSFIYSDCTVCRLCIRPSNIPRGGWQTGISLEREEECKHSEETPDPTGCRLTKGAEGCLALSSPGP